MTRRKGQITIGRIMSLVAAAALSMSLCRTVEGRETVMLGAFVMTYLWFANKHILRPLRKRVIRSTQLVNLR